MEAGDTIKSKGKETKAKEPTFVWEDDEVELLLKMTADDRTKKVAEGVDWESVKSKYQDILDLYLGNRAHDEPSADETLTEGTCSTKGKRPPIKKHCGNKVEGYSKKV